MIVTNKKDQSVSMVDPKTLTELARIKTTKKIVHGVAYSPDGRYAYVSQESIGADPGRDRRHRPGHPTVVSTIAVPGAADRHHHPRADRPLPWYTRR